MDIDKPLFGFIYRSSMRVKGIEFDHKLKDLIASQFHSRQQIEDGQQERLRRLVAHARRTVPHYRDIYSGEPEITNLTDLRQLPFLTKSTLKNNPAAMLSSERPQKMTRKTTAGSTGEPFSLWKSNESLEHELAATWRGYSWANIEIGDRQCRFWGTPLKTSQLCKSKLIDFIAHRKRVSAFAFDKESFADCTRQLVAFQPHYFYGYVSSVVEYAKHVRDTYSYPPFRLKGIVTTSEILTPSARHLLESTFDTRVYNEYGCAEFGTIAHECEHGALHVAAENMIVEIVDGDRVCTEGETGEIVITELSNLGMPLIRYRTGDIGSISNGGCRCGRALPVIESVEGRVWDMLERRDGRLFHPAFFLYIFEEARDRNLGIEHFKVHQTRYDSFLVKVVPGSQYSAGSEAFIRGEIKRRFDRGASVEFVKVTEIPREPSGKLRQVVGLQGHHVKPAKPTATEPAIGLTAH